MKNSRKIKRVVALLLCFSIIATVLQPVGVIAEVSDEQYPYTLYAVSDEEGAITVNSGNLCVNGSIATRGTVVVNGNKNVNGTVYEQTDDDMIYIFDRIEKEYFSSDDVMFFSEDYSISEMNLNIYTPMITYGSMSLYGNINLNTAVKSYETMQISGENININSSVVMSKYGNVSISGQNISMTGLIYAPFGKVTISAQNVNLNNVIIIADSIVLNGGNININYNSSVAQFVGETSEELNIPYYEFQYLPDADEDGLPDVVETAGLNVITGEVVYTDFENPDTDGDGLPDGYEVLTAYTNPTSPDTDGDGVSDDNEDFDEDYLINLDEYSLGTHPYCNDSDEDGLIDGDEVKIYDTDPLNSDTDGDSLSDGDEVRLGLSPIIVDTDGDSVRDNEENFFQIYSYETKDDCAVEEIILTMDATGKLESTTEIESVMNIDVFSSNVAGLIGEPFEITTEAEFDECIITFKVDKSQLGDTAFEDIVFLWFDEENMKYEVLETTHDTAEYTVSTVVTHFSRYMIVDSEQWFEAWSTELDYSGGTLKSAGFSTVLAVDCSGSMRENDGGEVSERYSAVYNFVQAMGENDKAGIVIFSDSALKVCELTGDKELLTSAMNSFHASGGTNINAALSTSLKMLESSASGSLRNIILLTDGEDTVSNTYITRAKSAGVKIHTVGLGDCDEALLQNISTQTEGEYFKAFSAEELTKIYYSFGIYMRMDETDTDGDGLPDAVETAGIRLINGDIITTNPTMADTDEDGLEDGEEIDIKLENKMGVPSIMAYKLGMTYYYDMDSDPRLKDSDSDGYTDFEEVKMFDSRPMYSDVKTYQLSEEYVSVYYEGDISWSNGSSKVSFGGNQGWFENYVSEENKEDFAYLIQNGGCGLISASDILLYLSKSDNEYRTEITDKVMVDENGNFNYYDYISYVLNMSEYIYVTSKYGAIAPLTALGINTYSNDYDLGLSAGWCISEDKMESRIKEMLDEDIPVTLCIGAGKEEVLLYNSIPDKWDWDSIIAVLRTNDHYVTITGIYIDNIAGETALEVSSWGKKYYINYEEFLEYVENNSEFYLSNIIYIKG